MSTIAAHLEGIDENLRDARRKAMELYGYMDDPVERNEWLLMLMRDLAIVEEHLESAMLLKAIEEKEKLTEELTAELLKKPIRDPEVITEVARQLGVDPSATLARLAAEEDEPSVGDVTEAERSDIRGLASALQTKSRGASP